jgi:ATP-dependent Clp protease ATP-binding subunit ClpA
MIQELAAGGAEDWEIDAAVRDLIRRGPAAAAMDELGKATGMPANVREAVIKAQHALGGHQFMRPELLNRIDEVVVFHQLKREHIRTIVEIQLERVRKRLGDRGITLTLTPTAADHLATEGWDPAFGARPLKRVIQQRLENALASRVLAGDFTDGDAVTVDYAGERFDFKKS